MPNQKRFSQSSSKEVRINVAKTRTSSNQILEQDQKEAKKNKLAKMRSSALVQSPTKESLAKDVIIPSPSAISQMSKNAFSMKTKLALPQPKFKLNFQFQTKEPSSACSSEKLRKEELKKLETLKEKQQSFPYSGMKHCSKNYAELNPKQVEKKFQELMDFNLDLEMKIAERSIKKLHFDQKSKKAKQEDALYLQRRGGNSPSPEQIRTLTEMSR